MLQKERAWDLSLCCWHQMPHSRLLLCHTGWSMLVKELGEMPGVETAWSTALFNVCTSCSSARCYLHPEHRAKWNKGPGPIDDWKRGSQECALPSHLWHSLRPHTATCIVSRNSPESRQVAGEKATGSRETDSSDSPGISWTEPVQSPTELRKAWWAHNFAGYKIILHGTKILTRADGLIATVTFYFDQSILVLYLWPSYKISF